MILKLLIITIIIVAVCFIAIGIQVWIKGKFPETEVGHNENMRKMGLCCAKEEEMRLWKNQNNNESASCGSCGSCLISNCDSRTK